MKIIKLLLIVLVSSAIILSCKKEETTINQLLTDADREFIMHAGISNYSEMEMAKVAISKTTDTIIQAYANSMITEHSKAQSDLKTMGILVGFTVRDSIDTWHAVIFDQLDTLTGRNFDSTYIHSQLLTHDSTIQIFKLQIEKGNQLNVRAYAGFYLPNLLLHRNRADSIATALFK